MNVVREINKINERELELGVKGSWHDEYKDSAYVFVGGLAYDLTEGDIITIMSQYGEVMDINMPRDPETGKPKGFCFLMYEDQRSTVLAVDNMTGAQVLGRTIRVDHCKKYEQKGTKNESGDYVAPEEPTYNAMPPTIDGSSDESSSDSEGDNLDEDDPMAAYLRQQKKTKKLTDGNKRKRDGESKEDKKARKEEKRRRKEERDRKRKAREGKKAKSGSEVKRERGESSHRQSRDDEAGGDRRDRTRSPSRGLRDTRDGSSSRHDREERGDRHVRRVPVDRDEHRRSRPRDSPEAPRQRSRPQDDRDDRDDRDSTYRRRHEPSVEAPRRRDDENRRRTDDSDQRRGEAREEVAEPRRVMMNPERERMLNGAGNGYGNGNGNGAGRDRRDDGRSYDRRPPQDDRYNRR